MKNIVVVEDGRKYEYSDMQEMIREMMGEEYENLAEEEKYKRLKLKTYMNAGIRNLPIKEILNGEQVENIESSQYILLNELTFLLSLAKNNDIVIYEQENSENFVKGIEKNDLERVSYDYIRVNDCADELLKKEIENYKVHGKYLNNIENNEEKIKD